MHVLVMCGISGLVKRVRKSITALGHLCTRTEGTLSSTVQLNDSHYVNKRTRALLPPSRDELSKSAQHLTIIERNRNFTGSTFSLTFPYLSSYFQSEEKETF